jgi:hypothetical protein
LGNHWTTRPNLQSWQDSPLPRLRKASLRNAAVACVEPLP